jgi:NAD(P)-dependent dehydrogenase (short-subunit alcohol dehydrogenase family)
VVPPLSHRVALVTGAAGGIGAAVAARLAQEGYRVACSDLAAGDAARAAAEIPGAHGFGCDLSSEAAVDGLRDAVTAELGTPWLLVNAAGVFFEHEVTELSLEQWDLVMNVNARGTFLTCRALLPAMQAARSGCIVNIASTAGLTGGHTRAAYNASKGAVVMFTRSLAIDCGPRGVRVNCVAPGLIDTPMADWIRLDPVRLAAFERSLPAGRIGTPADVADAVAFLASDGASYMHGSTLVVDGGVTA